MKSVGASSQFTCDLVPQGVPNVQLSENHFKEGCLWSKPQARENSQFKDNKIYLMILAAGLGLFGLYICTLRAHGYCLQRPEQGI